MSRPLLRTAARLRPHAPTLARRFASSTPPKPPARPPRQQRIRSRLDKWIIRSPSFFRPTLQTLRDAPASYIVSFAILHELTALVPLAGLIWWFHQYRWLPEYFADGKWARQGVEKFGGYLKKKGWIDEDEEVMIEAEVRLGNAREVQERGRFWDNEDRGRLLVEVGTAYAIVKVLLPVRILLSVWWAPPCARAAAWTMGAVGAVFRRGWSRIKSA